MAGGAVIALTLVVAALASGCASARTTATAAETASAASEW